MLATTVMSKRGCRADVLVIGASMWVSGIGEFEDMAKQEGAR